MATTSESTTSARSRRLLIAAIVFLWGVFGFFTICQVLSKDSAAHDTEKITELRGVTLASRSPSSSDWPQWRGPNRDGVSTETSLRTSWPAGGPRLLWEEPSGEGFSSMAVARGRVITMVQDKDHEAIVCWDADTGREMWRYRYPASYHNEFGNGPRGTPTIDGDLVFTVGATGIMTCLKVPPHSSPADTSGQPQLLWTKTLLEEFGARNVTWGTSLSPLVDGNLVFVGPGGPGGHSLVALDKTTGVVQWQSQDDAGSNSSPVLTEVAGVRQLVFFTESGLVAVTPDEGKLLWRFPWTTSFGANIATPIATGPYVFLASGYGKGCALVKIDKTDEGFAARQVYKNPKMRAQFSSCVLFKDHLYGFDDTVLTCMEFRTGKVAWSERGFDKGSLTIADGHLFILGEYGILAVAEATPDGYRENSRFTFSEKRCWTVPVIANGRLYVRNEEKIACYELR